MRDDGARPALRLRPEPGRPAGSAFPARSAGRSSAGPERSGYRWLDFGGLSEQTLREVGRRRSRATGDRPGPDPAKLQYGGVPFRYPGPVELIRPRLAAVGLRHGQRPARGAASNCTGPRSPCAAGRARRPAPRDGATAVNILCVGGGPGGLFFAIAAMARRPRATGSPWWSAGRTPRPTAGASRCPGPATPGTTCWPACGDRSRHRPGARGRPASPWSGQHVSAGGRAGRCTWAARATASSRQRLIDVLVDRARALGVRVEFGQRGRRPGAGGRRARPGRARRRRQQPAAPQPGRALRDAAQPGRNMHIWLSCPMALADFTFAFEPTPAGWIWFYGYPYAPDASTVIVECSQETWPGLGFDAMDDAATMAALSRLFARHLGGRPLESRPDEAGRSPWAHFPMITNERWHAGNVVLLGDCAHTVALLHRLGHEAGVAGRRRPRTGRRVAPPHELPAGPAGVPGPPPAGRARPAARRRPAAPAGSSTSSAAPAWTRWTSATRCARRKMAPADGARSSAAPRSSTGCTGRRSGGSAGPRGGRWQRRGHAAPPAAVRPRRSRGAFCQASVRAWPHPGSWTRACTPSSAACPRRPPTAGCAGSPPPPTTAGSGWSSPRSWACARARCAAARSAASARCRSPARWSTSSSSGSSAGSGRTWRTCGPHRRLRREPSTPVLPERALVVGGGVRHRPGDGEPAGRRGAGPGRARRRLLPGARGRALPRGRRRGAGRRRRRRGGHPALVAGPARRTRPGCGRRPRRPRCPRARASSSPSTRGRAPTTTTRPPTSAAAPPRAEVLELTADAGVDELLGEAAAAGRARALGVAGGDGSVAPAAAVAIEHGLPLAVIAAGTLNHFARDVGLETPQDTADAVVSGQAVKVDVADVNGTPFLNTSSIGAYPEMVRRRDQLSGRMGKWLALTVAAAQTLRPQHAGGAPASTAGSCRSGSSSSATASTPRAACPPPGGRGWRTGCSTSSTCAPTCASAAPARCWPRCSASASTPAATGTSPRGGAGRVALRPAAGRLRRRDGREVPRVRLPQAPPADRLLLPHGLTRDPPPKG